MSKQQVTNNWLGEYPVEVVSGSEGLIQVTTDGFALPKYDYVGVAYPLTTQEVYTFKTGGSGGTTVATITLNYTDSTKNNLSSAVRT